MTREQILRIAYWIAFAGVIGAFWIGLRSELYALEYTFIALGLWGVAFMINKQLKKEN